MNGLISQCVFDWQVLILVINHTLYPFYLRKHQKLSRCREMFGVRLMDKNRMNFFDFKSLTLDPQVFCDAYGLP